MPSESEEFEKLSDKQYRWFQVWVRQIEAIDRKATAIVTLDGLLLALTASFLGTSLGSTASGAFRVVFGGSTILILVSAASAASALWVREFLTERIAAAGGMEIAFEKFRRHRNRKSRTLQLSIVGLILGLAGYAFAVLVLLTRY